MKSNRKYTMNLNEYQEETAKTAGYPESMGITYCALALNGEAGEIAEKVKKVIRDNGGVWTQELKEAVALEAGDVLWYIARLSDELGYTLEEIAEMNLKKLRSRAERGKIQGSGDDR